MIAHICDLCRRPIPADRIEVDQLRALRATDHPHRRQPLDICPDCWHDFTQWIRTKHRHRPFSP